MNTFEPKIIAYVCNWCTYLGADLAGTNRFEYPPNIRIIRLPCTGRIDFLLIVKAFEVGADAVLVSGCHPGDCHYTSGNYHARRRWILFRQLLETMGIDTRRVHFSWISAAEGRKFQEFVTEVTEKTRELGPYEDYREICDSRFKIGDSRLNNTSGNAPAIGNQKSSIEDQQQLRDTCAGLLCDGKVAAVIGYGQTAATGPVFPAFITRPERCQPTGLERTVPSQSHHLPHAQGDPRAGQAGHRRQALR